MGLFDNYLTQLHTSSSGSSHGGKGVSFDGSSTNGVSYGSPSSGVSVSSGYGDYLDLLREISDYNNAFNLQQTQMVNEFNANEAQKNRDWQTEMSNSAHQRQVADLIKAGLNPVLSAGGQGAVTGSGAVASGQKAVADNILGQGAISLMSSMISASSAQSVAGIYAAASMYGADSSAATQREYHKILEQTNPYAIMQRYGTEVGKTLAKWLQPVSNTAMNLKYKYFKSR